jgi:putative oxidoreductase
MALGFHGVVQPDRKRGSPMPLEDRLHQLSPAVLSIVRIVVALLFFEHGLSKMFGFPSPNMPDLFTLGWFAGAIEFVTGALLTVGLATRAMAFIASGEMAFAYFLSHAPQSFFPILNRGDGSILYCFIFLFIAFAGAGPWSLDAALKARQPREQGAQRLQRQAGTRRA